MKRREVLSGLLAVLVSVSSVAAHHAATPVYDMSRAITVEGVVTEFRFVNPHSMMTMEARDPSGAATTWVVEFAGRLNLAETGWTENSINAGEHVTVTGSPTWEHLPRLFFRRLVRADGSELVSSEVQRASVIEEERKQRLIDREKGK